MEFSLYKSEEVLSLIISLLSNMSLLGMEIRDLVSKSSEEKFSLS